MAPIEQRIANHFDWMNANAHRFRRTSVYIVRDGKTGAIVDWSTNRRAAERSGRTWNPVVIKARNIAEALNA